MRSPRQNADGSDPIVTRGPLADRVREVLRSRPIQSDFGNRVLTFERFAASFEIDILGEALQIDWRVYAAVSFPLDDLDTDRLDARSVEVRKTDDAYHTRGPEPKHQQERRDCPFACEPVVGESASPVRRPTTRFIEQRCEHDA